MLCLYLLDIGVILIAFLLFLRRRRQATLPLPPGPKPLPIIGNYRDVPREQEWLTYREWAKTYGDIIHLNVFGTPMIILNTLDTAHEIFDKRSTIYNDRPHLTMLVDLMGSGRNIGLLHYGQYWREHRKMFHRRFNANAVEEYRPIQIREAHGLLRRLLDQPKAFRDHLRLMAGAMTLDVAYGIKVASKSDPYIDIAERAMYATSQAAIPGAFLVNSIPLLKYVPEWMPGAHFKTKAREWRKSLVGMWDIPFAAVKKKMADGIFNPSFTSTLLNQIDSDHDWNEEIIKNCAGSIYAGGSDSTVSALTTFILAMILYPEVQRKAHAAIDEAIGHDRLPEFSDRLSMPYVEAVTMEIFRWHMVAPLGVPHRSTREDVYKGYRIPAGSIVIANAWAILHDERVYPDPYTFNPDRFMKDRKLNPDVPSPTVACFGFGRRICPGQFLAQTSIWAGVACMLSVFKFSKAVDESGQPIEVTGRYTTGLTIHPEPFECSIVPRSKSAEALIRGTAVGA